MKPEPNNVANNAVDVNNALAGPDFMRPYQDAPKKTRTNRDLSIKRIMTAWPNTPHAQCLPTVMMPDRLKAAEPDQGERLPLEKAEDWDTRVLKRLADVAAANPKDVERAHSIMLPAYGRSLVTGNNVKVDIKSLLHLLECIEGLPTQAGDGTDGHGRKRVVTSRSNRTAAVPPASTL